MADLVVEKEKLIKYYVRTGILKSSKVIEAFRKIPREEFVLPEYFDAAYQDTPLPIGFGQTISAPHMVCMYAEILSLKPGLKVLEVGAGSGYNAAIFAELVASLDVPKSEWGHVYTLEIIPELCEFARSNLAKTGFIDRVTVICQDGSLGLAEYAPFDRISVAAAAPDIPTPLLDHLREGGLILIPVGSSFYQKLVLGHKVGGKLIREEVASVAFVALRGRYGWKE